MTETALARLEIRLHGRRPPWFIWIVGLLIAILVPVLLVQIGWALQLLSFGHNQPQSKNLELGSWLVLAQSTIGADQSRLRGVTLLLAGILTTLSTQTFLLWLLYESANQRTLDDLIALNRQLHEKSHELALAQSVSGQQSAMREATNVLLPRIREFMTRWHRSMPRHVVVVLGCWMLSACIQPLLTVLAIISLGLMAQLYRVIEQRRRTRMPVMIERYKAAVDQLHELNESGPLLSSVHAGGASKEAFESALRSYRVTEIELLSDNHWTTPFLYLSFSILTCAISFVMAVRIIDGNSHLDVAAVWVIAVAQLVAAISIQRIFRVLSRLTPARQAAARLLDILDQPVASAPSVDSLELPPISNQLQLEHVTLKESHGHKLLEDISLRFHPRQMTAIMASDRLQARALAELLLGFGRPTSGRMIYDSHLSTDLSFESIRKQCHWIAADGPLIAGTIEENLYSNGRRDGMVELGEALRHAQIIDVIQNLADGLGTMVTPHDGQFSADSLFRLGIARSILKQPSLVVAEEPTDRVKIDVESDSYSALRHLANSGMIVVVLPNRLTTIRSADQVILLHEHRIEGIGTHEQLLETNELYRHLNYVRFSPLRHVAG